LAPTSGISILLVVTSLNEGAVMNSKINAIQAVRKLQTQAY